MGILDGSMRMAVNWACYIAYVQAENEEYQKAQNKKEYEALAMAKMFKELEDEAEARQSRG